MGTGGLVRFNDGVREVDDHVYCTFEYPGGRTATFSTIESNAWDHYYEVFFGTKGTLLLRGEAEAYLFEEGAAAAAAPTNVAVTPKGRGPALEASESRTADAAGAGKAGSADTTDRLAAYRGEISTLLLGDPGRHAARLRARAGHALGGGLPPCRRGGRAEGAAPDARAPTPSRGPVARPARAAERGSPCPSAHPSRRNRGPSRRSSTTRSATRSCTARSRPGERIVIDELAKRLHVSAIPVREALRSLTSEGLVVNTPHVGATVAPITRESILDVFTLLEGLGGMAMRVVAERGSLGDIEALDQVLRDMDDALDAGRVEEWASLNTKFHTAVAVRTGLPLLREMTERVHDRWHRVRRFYFRGVLAQRADVAQAEHWQMMTAMRRQDYDRLYALSHQHNRGALESYLRYLGTEGEQAPVASAVPVLLPGAPR